MLRRLLHHTLLLTLFSTCFLQSAGVCSEESAAPKVIVNPQVNTVQLNVNQLRAIFSLRVRNWANGQPIRVVVLDAKHPGSLPFVREILNMLPHQLHRQWDRVIYSGLGQGPTIVPDEQAMLRHIANTPGAIGFISGATEYDNVQVLDIE